MKKSTAALLAIAAFLAGVLAGFSFAPIKHGIRVNIGIGDNSGNSNDFPPTRFSPEKGKKPPKDHKKKKKEHRLPRKDEIFKSLRQRKDAD